MAHGFSHKEGVDYEENFSPVPKYSFIEEFLSIAFETRWNIHKIDVKITFISVIIEEEVYIEQPYGFEVNDRETYVCSFNKSLYGLKQVPKAWYSRSDSNMQNIGFTKREVDPNLYFLLIGSKPHILVLYVDDLIWIGVEIDCVLYFRYSIIIWGEGYQVDASLSRNLQQIGKILPRRGKYKLNNSLQC